MFRIAFAVLTLVAVSSLSACSVFAVAFAPDRVASPASTTSEQGRQLLDEALREGAYDRLPEVISELTRLAIENPVDGQLHTALGMAHLWRVSERERDPAPTARLTEHVVLSRHYLESARQLLPQDARVHGWHAGSRLATATLLADEPERRAGYFDMQRAIRRFPAFNLFSASFVFSRLPADHPRYESQVIEPMFEVLRRCYGRADTWEDRRTVFLLAMQRSDWPLDEQRACYPSAAAPHNIEGFFLHFGDALSKAGRLEDAVQAWRMAELAPSYEQWPYRDVLERRIADPQAHSEVAAAGRSGEGMMITSAVSCSGCHQE